jgi:hypothetical protein
MKTKQAGRSSAGYPCVDQHGWILMDYFSNSFQHCTSAYHESSSTPSFQRHPRWALRKIPVGSPYQGGMDFHIELFPSLLSTCLCAQDFEGIHQLGRLGSQRDFKNEVISVPYPFVPLFLLNNSKGVRDAFDPSSLDLDLLPLSCQRVGGKGRCLS